MRSWSFVFGGALSLAAAAVLVTLSFGAPHTSAGNLVCVTATPIQPAVQPGVALPVCTPVQIVHSATPTFTATVPATSTPVPATPAPTQAAPTQAAPTQAAPTATQPSGGTGGQVTAPNTGSGSDGGSGYNAYLLLAAGAAAAAGGGSLLVALKRRR